MDPESPSDRNGSIALDIAATPDSSKGLIVSGDASQGYSNHIGDTSMMRDDDGRQGTTLSCHGVDYFVNVKKNPCSRAVRKQILHDVTCVFKPGMNAIMGPTGSGKTSLLDILADRKDRRGLVGEVLVEGRKQPKNFKCMTGYVVQDDIVMGTLSVRENITFSANVRLPANMTKEQKAKRVTDVINQLGLSRVADSKVGTEFIRGISGGERKRTNIGMELIIAPPVLFLDEPTTGLDSNTAVGLMGLLQRLSRKGTTVVFSIHQPRYSIFKLFDRLMLLGLGRTIYHGPSGQALDFFSKVGYECEEHDNPADFFLDVINVKPSRPNSEETTDAVVVPLGDTKDNNAVADSLNTFQDSSASSDLLAEEYKKTKWHKGVMAEAESIKTENASGSGGSLVDIEYATTASRQFNFLIRRSITNVLRQPTASLMQVCMSIVFGIVTGVVFYNTDEYLPVALQNRDGAFFFVVMNQVFMNLSSIELFIKERPMFIHEASSGFYRVSSYFFSKILGDVLPFRFFPVIAFSTVVYFMIGLQMDPGKYFIFLLTLFLTTMTAASVGFCMGASFRVYAIANLFTALTFVLMMIFGGFFVNLDTMVVWLSWLQYLSLFRHALNVLRINEYKDLTLCIPGNDTFPDICSVQFAHDHLTQQDIPYETAWNLWTGEVALLIIMLFFLTVAYIKLRTINKFK